MRAKMLIQRFTGHIFLLPAILLMAACTYVVPSTRLVTLQAGESETITIMVVTEIGGQVSPGNSVDVVSSDPTIFTVEQDPDTHVTIHALRPGSAYILLAKNLSERLVTVQISSCSPVSTKPQITEVQALVGIPIGLHVLTDNPNTAAIWNQEVNGGWQVIPFASGNLYAFTPPRSGTFRFLVRYPGYCDDDDTLITVIASTRGRATRH
jgi:hypothetical protein